MVEPTRSKTIALEREEIKGTVTARWAKVWKQFPERPALRGENQSFTFHSLECASSGLASAIGSMAPDHHGCIGLLAPQSAEMVLGSLAILKTGNAILGLHPGQPDEALLRILFDAKPHLLLYEEGFKTRALRLAEEIGASTLPLSERGDELSTQVTDGSLPCSILYTSGSTGEPKGVVKSHSLVLHRVLLAQEHDQIALSDRASLLTHVGFASAEADIFATLLLGGCVCVFDVASNGLTALKRWLYQEQITLFHPPVTLFRHFLKSLTPNERFDAIRLVALAGDVVVPEDLEIWKNHFSLVCEIRHRFSTTETAMLSVAHYCHDDDHELHCGRPVQDKSIEICLDSVPQGPDVQGDIVVRSHYLASGYWNKPDQTSEVFQICQATGKLLYNTGDLGYLDTNGNLHFVGRKDDQVKIRGFRLTCREVEAAFLSCGEISEVAVRPHESHGQTGLSAWVSLGKGANLDTSELRQRLSTRLPDWKIPSRISIQDTLPKTLTGKIDKVALVDGIPKLPSIQERIANIWEGLDRTTVSPQDDLLQYGGDSITIVLLLHEIEKEFAVGITPRQFFEERTLAHLAKLVADGTKRESEAALETPSPIRKEASIHSVADGFLSLLNQHDLDFLFLNPGTDSAPLLESFVKFRAHGLKTPKLVLCMHESVAMNCAQGFFMVSRKPQMVFVHVDLGTQNVGGSLHNAQRGRAAVVLVAGRSPYTLKGETASRDRYAHWIQEQRDQTGIVRNYVKWDYTLPCSENLSHSVERAFQIACSAPAGPVYLTIPREVMMESLEMEPALSRPTIRSRKAPDPDLIDQIAELIWQAQFPLIVASRSGSDPRTVNSLINLCELVSLPVVETRHRFNFPNNHPLHLGFSPNQFLPKTDLLISLEHEVPWIPKQWEPREDCQIVQVDIDTEKADIPIWGFPVDIALESDTDLFLRALTQKLKTMLTQERAERIEERRRSLEHIHGKLRQRWKQAAQERSTESPLAGPWLGHCLNSVIDDNTLVVCDAATNNPVFWTYLALTQPGSFFQSSGSSLGWGLGAAVGAKLAAPERTVIALVGDGGWMFSNPLAVYEASRQQDAPFLTVLLNNEKYAAISEAVQSLAPEGEARRLREFPGCQLTSPGYYSRIAEAAGLWSQLVTNPQNLLSVLESAMTQVKNGRSAMVEVWVSATRP